MKKLFLLTGRVCAGGVCGAVLLLAGVGRGEAQVRPPARPVPTVVRPTVSAPAVRAPATPTVRPTPVSPPRPTPVATPRPTATAAPRTPAVAPPRPTAATPAATVSRSGGLTSGAVTSSRPGVGAAARVPATSGRVGGGSASRPASRPAAVAQERAPHGNSRHSNRPQTVYGIFETNRQSGQTRLHKWGVSDKPVGGGVMRQRSPRAEGQLRDLKARHPESVFQSRIVRQIPAQPAGRPTARSLALQAEKDLVTRHAIKRDAKPVGNRLPNPNPFSHYPPKGK